MTYTYKQNLVSSSKYSVKCPYSLTPQYIVVHDTANSAPASNEISYMIRNDNQVSFHIAVDEKEAIQGLPLNRNAWACGDGTNGNGNRKGISVEICRPTNSDRSLYDQSEENAVYVVARLLHKYGLGIDRLKRHYDFATNKKQCPNVIIREGRWDNFKSRVEWVLGEIKKGTIESSLESGTTSLKNTSSSNTTSENKTTTVQSVEMVSTNKKVKIVKDVNVWCDVEWKNVKTQAKKGSIYHVTKQTKDGNFFLIEGGYVSTSSEFSLASALEVAPRNKVMAIRDCSLFTYCDGKYCIGNIKEWEVYETIDYKDGWYLIFGLGWVHESHVKTYPVTNIACTNGIV